MTIMTDPVLTILGYYTKTPAETITDLHIGSNVIDNTYRIWYSTVDMASQSRRPGLRNYPDTDLALADLQILAEYIDNKRSGLCRASDDETHDY